jgi:hypothetical protein
MYRTGDLGAWTESMEIQFLGRVDNQVKVRGYRIELEEIENAIQSADKAVRYAVAVVAKDNIISFVSPVGINIDSIQEALRSKLPAYAQPATIIALNSFPLTPNQKINRKALQEKALEVSGTADLEPLSALESTIAGLWRDVLQLDRGVQIGPNHDFLSLGGNSLRQITTAQRMSVTFGKRVPLAMVITNTVLRDLAAAIEAYLTKQDEARLDSAAAPFIKHWESAAVAEGVVSPLEEEFYTLHSKSEFPSTFNVAYQLSLHGKVDIDRLCDALVYAVQENEIFGSNYVLCDGRLQRTQCESLFSVLRLQNNNNVEVLRTYIDKPFDLSRDQLTRICLLEGETSTILLFIQHHIITDKVSIQIFFKQVCQQYRQLVSGGSLPTSKEVTSPGYKEWASWQLLKLSSNQVGFTYPNAAAPSYWASKFNEPPSNPFTATKSAWMSGNGKTEAFPLHHRDDFRGSLEMYLAVVSVAVPKVLGIGDLVLGVPYFDRTEPGTEEMLGVFLDRLPIRVPSRATDSRMEERVKNMKSELRDSLSHAIPYRDILQIANSTSLFDIIVVYNRRDDLATKYLGLPGVTVKEVPKRAQGAKFPLLVEFNEGGEDTHCELEYCVDLVDEVVVQSLKAEIICAFREIRSES